jgi:exoribonuclease R|tara:strand:+ start:539 stop:757 length:219 start_codon:yes stop_codon:yes gene_type:complete
MFIELTEIVTDRMASYASTPKKRSVCINREKIQAFFPEINTSNTVIQLRRENIKVIEDYETVKNLVNKCKNS